MKIQDFLNKHLFGSKKKRKQLLSESKVFCMAPWIQLHAQTNGKVAPCCMSSVHLNNEFIGMGDLRENPRIEAAWNSDNMKQLRRNMLEGKKSSICTHCYDYEKLGKFSERMKYNSDYWHEFSRVRATAEDGSLIKTDVPLIDIRFTNKCNFKCRICDSVYSSLWYEDELKIDKKPPMPTTKEMKMAFDDTGFWESFKRLLKGVKRLHFAGGEPLVMDEHYRTLEYLLSIGKTDVNLSYNTNFSTLKYKQYNIIELWNRFKKVDVWASLDGMGSKGDYQRKGQRWQKIEDNIRQVQNHCPSVLFGVNVTVSIFNVLHVPEFYRYMVENKLVAEDRMNLYLLFDPPYFNITNLTPALKQKVAALYEKFEREYLNTLDHNANIKNHAQSIINFMMSEQGSRQAEFSHWVNAVDNIRNEKFTELFPELREMMEPETNHHNE